VGIDEWAWKKGHQYGTILVNLAERRVVQLLADRSVETSKAWLRTHPEIRIVSRDRGKLFREAATNGAPQAQQVVDRFHLQKNFAEALEKFLRHKTRVLKAGARSVAGKARPAPRRAVPQKEEQERRARHRQRVAVHKRVWKLYREGYHKEQIAQLIGISSQSVYRILKQEAAPPPRRRSRSHSVVDPYLSYLSARWNQGCHKARQLYKEIVAQGYTGSLRRLEMRLRAFRPHVAHPVSKQTITLSKPPSARSTALMIVRPVQNRTPEQTAFLEQLIQSDATVTKAFTLAQDFGRLLRKREGLLHLEQWKIAVQASGIAELIAFADGLADDAEAVANGCTLPWSNGMVEGFVNKVKAIKRSSYGQVGFPLLQRRVLLHLTHREPSGKDQIQRSSQRSIPPVRQDASNSRSTPTASAPVSVA
jgi:transposase